MNGCAQMENIEIQNGVTSRTKNMTTDKLNRGERATINLSLRRIAK